MLLCWTSGMTFHIWKSQSPSQAHVNAGGISGLKPRACTIPPAKGWKEEILSRAPHSALLNSSCDQAT